MKSPWMYRSTAAFTDGYTGTLQRIANASVCYTEKAKPARHRPERQHNASVCSRRERGACMPISGG